MCYAYEKTYTDDDKIKAGPSICEVSPQAESYPLEYHLYEEQHRKHQVDDFQNKHQLSDVEGEKKKLIFCENDFMWKIGNTVLKNPEKSANSLCKILD